MPQMAPISWLILMVLFSCCFLIFNVLNFYCLSFNKNSANKINSDKNFNKKLNNFLNWKW